MKEICVVLGFVVAVGLQILRMIEEQPRESTAEFGTFEAESPLARQSGRANSAEPVISPTARE
jgi:hypothetical protein